MDKYCLLSEKFNINRDLDKIIVNENLLKFLDFLKNTPEYDFDMLTSIIAVDMNDYIELIYQLYSKSNNENLSVKYIVTNNTAPSVVNVYSSADFDEREIYDLFGVRFEGHENLKRILLPETWIGHPLLKSYTMQDERLNWNE